MQGKSIEKRAEILNGDGRRSIKAIVFDFDGTLAELHLDFAVMKQKLAVLVREYLDDSPATSLPALEWVESLTISLRNVHAAAGDIFQEKAEAIILNMELEAARKGRLFEFTRPLLDALRRDNIQTAIITRNCEPAVRMVFPDVESYCRCFLSREHVTQVKPHPEHLLSALQRMSIEPESALMVGDHPIDIDTGKRAGVRTAGVYSGNASQTDLLESGAQWVARNCRDLVRALKNQGLL